MLKFELVSVTDTKFEGEVYEVLLPTQAGIIAVFEDHMPLISAAQPGVVSVRKQPGDKDDDMEHFAVNGGVLEVDGKTLRFIADDIDAPGDVSEKEAEAAMARAEELVAGAGVVELAEGPVDILGGDGLVSARRPCGTGVCVRFVQHLETDGPLDAAGRVDLLAAQEQTGELVDVEALAHLSGAPGFDDPARPAGHRR